MPQAVIMAGGEGERFWPLTYEKFPKYRIEVDGESLLQKTYKRLSKIYSKNNIHVVTTKDHAVFIREEIPALPKVNLLIEPCRKNTGPAVCLSDLLLAKRFGEDEMVSFFPADHLIKDETAFQGALKKAMRVASEAEVLVMFGVKPTFPATGYGYIERGMPLEGGGSVFQVDRFVEKPNRRRAVFYLKQGCFLWNAGIFTWKIGTFLNTVKMIAPEIFSNLNLKSLPRSYKKLPSISVDKAVLEKAGNRAVVAVDMDWCDMGSWDMFLSKFLHRSDGNLIHGPSFHEKTKNSLLLNYTDRPLVTLGLSDLAVVQTERGTLICRRGFSEEAARLKRYLT